MDRLLWVCKNLISLCSMAPHGRHDRFFIFLIVDNEKSCQYKHYFTVDNSLAPNHFGLGRSICKYMFSILLDWIMQCTIKCFSIIFLYHYYELSNHFDLGCFFWCTSVLLTLANNLFLYWATNLLKLDSSLLSALCLLLFFLPCSHGNKVKINKTSWLGGLL